MDLVAMVAHDLADLLASNAPATHIVRALRTCAGTRISGCPAPDRGATSVFDTMTHVDDELERSILVAAQDPPTAVRLLVLMRELQRTAPGEQRLPSVERADDEGIRRILETDVAADLLDVYRRTVAYAYPWAGSEELDAAALYCALRDVVVAGAVVQGVGVDDERAAREDAAFLDDLLGAAPTWPQLTD